ncbi:MAG: hypothetical protein ACQESR_10095 [Planctomycetota bacterium]
MGFVRIESCSTQAGLPLVGLAAHNGTCGRGWPSCGGSKRETWSGCANTVLSWMISLAGPTVLAIDQIDPIVTYLNIVSGDDGSDELNEAMRVARTIIENIAAGLGVPRDVTQRTFIVIAFVN